MRYLKDVWSGMYAVWYKGHPFGTAPCAGDTDDLVHILHRARFMSGTTDTFNYLAFSVIIVNHGKVGM